MWSCNGCALALISCVMIAAGCDRTPPEVVQIDRPAWIHDWMDVEFSEEVHSPEPYGSPAVLLTDGSGMVLDAERWAVITMDDHSVDRVRVRIGEDGTHVGPIRAVFSQISDGAGNSLVAEDVAWTIAPWAFEEADAELDDDVRQLALLGSQNDALFQSPLAAIWVTGAPGEEVIRSLARADGVWTELQERPGTDIAVAGHRSRWAIVSRCGFEVCVGYLEAGRSYDGWFELASPPVAAPAGIAVHDDSPTRTTYVVAGPGDAAVEVARYGDDWESLPSIPATDVVGRPAIGLSNPLQLVVAFVDRTAVDQLALRVVGLDGDGWTEWGSTPVTALDGDVMLVVREGAAVVGWNDGGGRVASVSPVGIDEIALPTTAATRIEDVAISDERELVVSWTEDGAVAQLGWYRQLAWELAEPRTGAAGMVGLWSERVPVVGWVDGGRLQLALFNGVRDDASAR